jgi:hypothetical protein
VLAAFFFAALSPVAWCNERATPAIDPTKVCDTNHIVNKKKLAVELLEGANVPLSIVIWAQTSDSKPPAMDPLGFLLVVSDLACDKGAECGKKGAETLILANDNFLAVLKDAMNIDRQSGYFALSGSALPEDSVHLLDISLEYFRNPDYQIVCTGGPARPAALPLAKTSKGAAMVDIRVRGKATDLYSLQGSDSFKAADKATISYAQDDIKHRHVRVGSGVVGVGLRLANDPPWGPDGSSGNVNLVPYIGIASNITKASGSNPSVNSNTRQIGLMLYGYTNLPTPYFWTIRPDLLWNLSDNSRLLTLNAGYVPIVLNYVNSTREFLDGYWFQWVVDARLIHGHYTDVGARKPEDSRDFSRFGGEVGFQFDHTGSVFPWNWKVAETYLHGSSGVHRNLAQLNSTLSLTFDDKKLVGVDFTYTKGRNPDTAEMDQSWKIGIGVKY